MLNLTATLTSPACLSWGGGERELLIGVAMAIIAGALAFALRRPSKAGHAAPGQRGGDTPMPPPPPKPPDPSSLLIEQVGRFEEEAG